MLRSLDRLGASASEEEALGYKLIWRYTTWLLGVPQALLGRSDDEKEVINSHILPLAFNPDGNSCCLTDALMSDLSHMPRLAYLPRGFHEALSRRLLGSELADGVRMQAMVASMVLGLRGYGLLLRLPKMAPWAAGFGQHFMSGFLTQRLAGVAADFQEYPR